MARMLGAAYVGMIFTRSPRQLQAAEARTLVAGTPIPPLRVGVFGSESVDWIVGVAREAELGVIQLHADPTPDHVRQIRAMFEGEVWAAVRVESGELPGGLESLFEAADAVLLDARPGSAGNAALGGTGTRFDWAAVAGAVRRARGAVAGARLVLAGGLHSGNVAEAVRLLSPDVVDVSSGVERAPGIKDHDRMREFTMALQGVSTT